MMRHFANILLSGALVAGSGYAAAQTAPSSPSDTAAAFGARQRVANASLSPDGTKIAYLAPLDGQGSALYVAPLDGSATVKPIIVATGDPERLDNCKWAADARLVCTIYGLTKLADGEHAYFSRQVAVDANGKNIKVLIDRGGGGQKLGYQLQGGGVIDWMPDERGGVLMTRDYVPEASPGSNLGSKRHGLGVVRLDTGTLATEIVENPRRDAVEYITDGRGTVRIMGSRMTQGAAGYDSGKFVYQYRVKGSRDWKALSTVDSDGGDFNPYGIDPELDQAYGLKKLDGRFAAYRKNLDGSGTETLVFAHPEVDVDGFVRIGRRGRIVGVSYATDRRQAKYFDRQLEALATSLSKAIPDLPLIHFLDASADETKLLIWAGSDTDPGRYFLFDRKTRKLDHLLPVRPELDQLGLAPVKAVNYRARDGTMIPGYLTLPPGRDKAQGLPGIVMPHGGPGSSDEWGFDWLAQYFANRGFAVLQPNFRGSSGYGNAWFQRNGFQNWRAAIGDVNDGGRWLVSEGVDAGKLAIVGWSYGGYAALQSAVVDPQLFKASVAIAPVTDLNMLKESRRGWTDYQIVSRYVGSGAHVEEGSPARNAEKIKVPVLLFHGTLDRNVEVGHSRTMASRLKGAGGKIELVTYDKLDHYLDDSRARIDMLRKSDAFLRTSLGL